MAVHYSYILSYSIAHSVRALFALYSDRVATRHSPVFVGRWSLLVNQLISLVCQTARCLLSVDMQSTLSETVESEVTFSSVITIANAALHTSCNRAYMLPAKYIPVYIIKRFIEYPGIL